MIAPWFLYRAEFVYSAPSFQSYSDLLGLVAIAPGGDAMVEGAVRLGRGSWMFDVVVEEQVYHSAKPTLST
jgi:hypothetical protein